MSVYICDVAVFQIVRTIQPKEEQYNRDISAKDSSSSKSSSTLNSTHIYNTLSSTSGSQPVKHPGRNHSDDLEFDSKSYFDFDETTGKLADGTLSEEAGLTGNSNGHRELLSELEEERESKEKLRVKKEKLRVQLKETTAALKESRAEAEELGCQVAEVGHKWGLVEVECSDLQSEVVQLRERVRVHERWVEDTRSSHAAKKEDDSSETMDGTELRKYVNLYEALQQKHEHMENFLTEALNMMRKDVSKLKKENVNLKRDRNELETVLLNHGPNCEKKSRELDQINGMIEQLTRQISEVQGRCESEACSGAKKLLQKLQENEETVVLQQAQFNKLKVKKKEQATVLANAEKHLQELETARGNSEERYIDLVKQSEHLKCKLADRQALCEADSCPSGIKSTSKSGDLRYQVQYRDDTITTLREKVEKLVGKKEDLRREVAVHKIELGNTANLARESEAARRKLEQESDRMKEEVRELRKNCKEGKCGGVADSEQVQEARRLLREKNEQCDVLIQEVGDCKRRAEEVRDEKAGFRRQLDNAGAEVRIVLTHNKLLTKEAAGLSEQVAELQRQLMKMGDEISEKQNLLEEKERDLEEKEKLLEGKDVEIKEMELVKELEKACREIESVKDSINAPIIEAEGVDECERDDTKCESDELSLEGSSPALTRDMSEDSSSTQSVSTAHEDKLFVSEGEFPELTAAREKIARQRQKIRQLKDEYLKLKDAVSETNSQICEIMAPHKPCVRPNCQEVQQRADELAEELEETRKKLNEMDLSNADLTLDLTVSNCELEKKQAQCNTQQDILRTTVTACKDLEEKVKAQETMLQVVEAKGWMVGNSSVDTSVSSDSRKRLMDAKPKQFHYGKQSSTPIDRFDLRFQDRTLPKTDVSHIMRETDRRNEDPKGNLGKLLVKAPGPRTKRNSRENPKQRELRDPAYVESWTRSLDRRTARSRETDGKLTRSPTLHDLMSGQEYRF